MYHVYFLKHMETGELYYGYTAQLERRITEHQAEGPWQLVYYEAYQSEQDARTRERALKQYGQTRAHLKKRLTDSLAQRQISAGFNSHSHLRSPTGSVSDVLIENGYQGCTMWFTGLPCSGKTTIAEIVLKELQERGVRTELLDGDELRKHFSAGVGFSKQDRSNHLKRVAYLAHLLTKHGVVVLASFVSPYRENREYARQLISNGTSGQGGQFVEVYADCPVDVCIQRDVKGMYKKALAGEIKEFTGVSDPYEPPPAPELIAKTNEESLDACVQKCLTYLEQQFGVPSKERACAST